MPYMLTSSGERVPCRSTQPRSRTGSSASPPKMIRRSAVVGPCGVPVGLDEPVERRRGLVEHGHSALLDQPVEVDRGTGQRVLRHQQLSAVHQRAPQLPDSEVEGVRVELDPHVLRAEVHVGPGVREQCHHAGVRDDDALGPAGRSGRVDHVRRVVPACRGVVGQLVGLRQLVPLDEHAGRQAFPGQQFGEAVPLFTVDENDLRSGVGEDVLQSFVRVRQVQRHVRAARGDDRDEGDDLLQGAGDGDGHALARSDTGRSKSRGQLVLRRLQFPVGQ